MKAVRWKRTLVAIGSESSTTSGLRCPAIILRSVLSAAFLFMFVGPLAFCTSDNLELIEAAVNGNIIKVTNLLTQGADVNVKDSNGLTALMMASMEGHSKIVNIFLANGADVNSKNNDDVTVLMAASLKGSSRLLH